MEGDSIHTSLSFLHSRFPCWQTHSNPLDSEVLSSTSRKLDVCQILLKIEKKLLSVGVAKLTVIPRSKVLDVDDDMYPIISHYRDFGLERHETHPHSSENVSNIKMIS
jgi:hypothetical protein